jgi:hypothetical protein
LVIAHGYGGLNLQIEPARRANESCTSAHPGVGCRARAVAARRASHQPLKWPRSIDPRRLKVQSPPADGAGDLLVATRTCRPGFRELRRGGPMFDLRDLFQWERFITPSIIKVFYWLAVIITVVFGLSGTLSGLAVMMLQPLTGLFLVLSSVLGMLAGVILIRILSEFVLITFRINEHLGAIRNRGQM